MYAVQCENNRNKTGSKKWWGTVNSITSKKLHDIPISNFIDPRIVNVHFQNINTGLLAF